MMQKPNYQRQMETLLRAAETPPHILLHVCCAPCSSAVIEQLAPLARLTLLFYNPNIPQQPALIEGVYEPEVFLAFAQALADAPERGERCRKCIRLRIGAAARKAAELGADYFATTLTVSPHKDAADINAAGAELAAATGIAWLPSDFKKKDGYKRSIALSAQYCLYRQNYCGCPFSKRD